MLSISLCAMYIQFLACFVLNVLLAGRLLEDARNDPYYRSWFSKVQAALRHCCGRALRQELEQETRLVSVLMQVAEKIRIVEKSRRKVRKQISWHLPIPQLLIFQGLFI